MRKFHQSLVLLSVFVTSMGAAVFAQCSNAFRVDEITLGTNNSIQLKWRSETNALYHVQYLPVLTTNTTWISVATGFSRAGATSFWTDLGNPSAAPPRPPNGTPRIIPAGSSGRTSGQIRH